MGATSDRGVVAPRLRVLPSPSTLQCRGRAPWLADTSSAANTHQAGCGPSDLRKRHLFATRERRSTPGLWQEQRSCQPLRGKVYVEQNRRIERAPGGSAKLRREGLSERRGLVEHQARSHLRVGSGLQFLQLALEQVFGVLRITSCKWSQSDGSTALWDDHEVKPNHQEGLHRDVVDVSKGNGCGSSLTRDLGANELDTVPEDPQTLVAYGRYLPC